MKNKGICFELFSSGAGICLFGATGDLAKKKIIPSLCSIYLKEFVRENFFVLNTGSKDYDDESFRNYIAIILKNNGISDYDSFIERNYYVKLDYSDINSFSALVEKFRKLCSIYSVNNNIFYLSIIPSEIKNTLKKLHIANCFEGNFKIILEKPYGSDFKDACEVASFLDSLGLEDKVYRIDHYTAKDGVLNLFLFRMLNYAFENIMNKNLIDSVQVTLYESEGVENRIKYFDSIGLFRDMFSHLIQILSFMTMDLPQDVKSHLIKEKKRDILKYVSVDYSSFIRARYDGYQIQNSDTETFVAFKLYIKSSKWRGVPFYIKMGKMMKEKVSRIDIVCKATTNDFIKRYQITPSNVLTFYLQPENRIDFLFVGKSSGPKFCVTEKYLSSVGEEKSLIAPSDYERLLLDCINGDRTLFIERDEVNYMWSHMDRYLRNVKKGYYPLYLYKPKENPPEIDSLILKDGRQWIYL